MRAEILFDCRLDPWRKVADLTGEELVGCQASFDEMNRSGYPN